MKIFYVKVFLKCKNKINLCIYFLFLIMIQVPYSWYKVHNLTRITKRKVSILLVTSQFLTDFVNSDNICHVILKTKLFLSGVLVSVNRRRKDIKLIFVSLSFHSGRSTVICKEYGNKLFSYFDILIYVSSNFTLDLRITKCLQGHIGLQLHTSFINFGLVKFRKN